MLLLSTSGVSSAVERSLLASTQQRQSPSLTALAGFSTFILDGVKLFSKVITSCSMTVLTLPVMAATLYTTLLLFDNVVSITQPMSLIALELTCWLLISILEFVSLGTIGRVQNNYASVVLVRAVEILVVAELTLGFVMTVLLQESATLRQTSTVRTNSGLLLAVLAVVFAVLHCEKAPFDVIEAESELIDGFSLEFEGTVFSVGYAAEALLGFIILKLLSLLSGWNIIPLMLGLLALFFGRAFIVRFVMSDVLELLIGVLMVLATVVLVVVTYKSV